MNSVPTAAAFQQMESLEQQLRDWDWLADLELAERNIPWLARKTNKSQRSLYSYKYGQARPSMEWLRDAYRVLKGG